jgi:hypothetical protein
MKKSLLLLLCMGYFNSLFAQNTYFFPSKKLNPAIPSPEQFLGYAIGSHHTRHDKLVEYMRELDRVSDKVSVQKIGETFEHREQIILTITNPTNAAKLESIRREHLDLCNPSKPLPDVKNMPSIVWLGYNVHGNEPSSSEAAMLTAYYLAASEEPEMTDWLANAVILMEPVINPDGRDRHTFWADANRGNPLVSDPNDREHNEAWPGGRTNHYWFDLNRDWYLAVNIESRNRLNFYHQWLPNVVTDFHEMGTNATHFFEPTKENAENPLVPKSVYRDLNGRFAKYFEEAMNSIGSLYYTKESFDNFYPGYGSSYPDMEGGLGLLFEQASSRGHLQESQNGDLSFAFTIRNQLTNGLATVKASLNEREILLKHQHNFFVDVISQAQKSTTKAYIIGNSNDGSRNRAFWDLLLQHKIEFYQLNDDIVQSGQAFEKGKSVIIPTNQSQYLMIRSIFDRPKTFADSIFYDASTWNLALAYGLPHAEITTNFTKGEKITKTDLSPNIKTIPKSNYAYLVDYADYNATKVLYQLLDNQILTKVSMKPFSVKITGTEKKFGYGTLVIPVNSQKISTDELHQRLTKISQETGVIIESVSTGFSTSGIDLGSNSVVTVKKPQALMLVGGNVTSSEAGEVWHLLDTKIGMPITKIDIYSFPRINLSRYNTMVMVGGNYGALDKSSVLKIKAFVANGGTLITLKGASEWVIKNDIVKEKIREIKADSSRTKARINYEDYTNSEGAKATGGAIFEADLDISNPICFGYQSRKISLYRNNNTLLEPSNIAANTVMKYTENPWICGYVHKETLKKISNSAGILVANEGSGRVILFSDNPNFRGTWFGTNKLFLNALFFGGNISSFRGFDGETDTEK